MSGIGRLLLFFFFLPSVPDVTINQIKVGIICVLSFSTSLLLPSFLMEHNLQQLQDCFVSLHSHVKVQVKNLELDLLWLYPVGRGILKERVSLARRSANILVNRGCLTGRCFIAPRPSLKPEVTFGVGWSRQELRAWLAMSMGGIKQDPCCMSPPPVSPSHHCVMGWPQREVQPAAHPSVN